MFLFQSPSIYPLNLFLRISPKKRDSPENYRGGGWWFVGENKKRESKLIPLIFVTPTGFKPVTF